MSSYYHYNEGALHFDFHREGNAPITATDREAALAILEKVLQKKRPQPDFTEAEEVAPVSEDFVNPCIETVKALVEKGSSIVVPAMLAKYREVWKSILADEMFTKEFQVISPRDFEGNYNQKLFCNILGFLKEHQFFTKSSADDLGKFFYEKSVKRYIYYFMPQPNNQGNSILHPAMLAKMKYLLE